MSQGLLSDAELEAPPGRRLLVFAASFLGLLALANVNFAGVPLIAPPVAMVLVLLIAGSGLLVWIRGRWSRALLHIAAGIACMAGAAVAILFQTVPAISALLLLVGAIGLGAGAVAAAGLFKDTWPTLRNRMTWVVVASASLMALLAVPVAGARVAATTALGCIMLAWLLRPIAPVDLTTD